MAIFPSDDPAIAAATRARLRPKIESYSSRFIENVKRNATTSGKSQARDVWGRLKLAVDMEFDLRVDDIELLTSFWETYRISGFTFFDFEKKQFGSPGYRAVASIGTGTGATQTLTLPAKETSGHIIYANGVLKAGPYTVNAGAGALGEDTITLTAAQNPTGQAITVAFLGRAKVTCECVTMSKSTVEWNRQKLALSLLEKF